MKKRLFYDLNTREVFFENYMNIDRTIEEDRNTFQILQGRIDTSYDYLDVDYELYKQDFAECNGYRVNVETKTLEFSYPDPNEPDVEQPYQAPLSEQIAELRAENVTTLEAIAEVYELVLGGA